MKNEKYELKRRPKKLDVDIKNDVFIGNIPNNVRRKNLIRLFERFGDIKEIVLHDYVRKSPYFAFIKFTSYQSKIDALKMDRKISIGKNYLHVEERKPKYDKLPWDELNENIDFVEVAANYVFRKIVMEDHLLDFILKFASYRNVKKEKYETLEHLLIRLSDSHPDDMVAIMPPHLSGMVFNKTKLDQKTGRLSLDIKSILDDCRDITIENDWIVYNLPKVPKQEAAENLHEVLVKGLFIYFLAKFAHGPVFRVKLEYYITSEPIRTTLQLITGGNNVNASLSIYFKTMKDFFNYDDKKQRLTLVNDYFNKSYNREELRKYLKIKEPEFKEPKFEEPSILIQNKEGWIRRVNDAFAIIQFIIVDENCNKSSHFAYLTRDKFKCKAILSYPDKIFFNAESRKDAPEGCNWICSAAWIDGKNLKATQGIIIKIEEDFSGVIEYTDPYSVKAKAVFEESNFFLEETENLIGQKVQLDVERDDTCNVNKATCVWIGERPDPIQINYLKVLNQHLDSPQKIDKKQFNVAIDLSDEEYEELPNSVKDVVNDVFKEEKVLKYLVNTDVLDELLTTMNIEQKTPEIKIALEKGVRSLLSKSLSTVNENSTNI